MYAYFLEAGHDGIDDIRVKIIDKTDVNDPIRREGFLTYELKFIYTSGTGYKRFYIITFIYVYFEY